MSRRRRGHRGNGPGSSSVLLGRGALGLLLATAACAVTSRGGPPVSGTSAPAGARPVATLERSAGAVADVPATPAADDDSVAPSDPARDPLAALVDGEAWVKLRFRVESVEQDAFAKDAEAFTLRTAIGYETATYEGLSALFEVESVNDFGEAYNSTVNGTVDRPVIADPEATEVDQAYVQYAPDGRTTVRAGRQRIVLDNARFIGDVAWRQNHQSFDAVTVTHRPSEDTELFYGWLHNANRIFSERSPVGDARMRSHLVHASSDVGALGRLTGYWYYLDFRRGSGLLGQSRSTVGVRLAGDAEVLADRALRYVFEFANQQDVGHNPMSVNESYSLSELGTDVGPVQVAVGREVLGGSGDGSAAFGTPLATLHAFNGWADLFLTTPGTGLDDRYLSVGGRIGPVKLRAIYHDFDADATGSDFGDELDLLATAPIDERSRWGVKFADYDARDFGTDTERYWFWYEVDF